MSEGAVRPPNVPYPNVWLTFEAADENGQLEKYLIQDMPPQRFKHALRHMKANYLTDATLCRARNIINSQKSVGDITYIWDEIIREEQLTLACFKEGSDEIIGMDVLYVEEGEDDEDEDEYEGKHVKEMDLAAEYVWNEFDVFEHYKADCYLTSYGLSVLPKYRRRGIGLKLLEARKYLGSACGIPLTSDLFPSSETQKLAEKAGFEKNFEITFGELAKKNKCFSFDVNPASTYAMYSMRL